MYNFKFFFSKYANEFSDFFSRDKQRENFESFSLFWDDCERSSQLSLSILSYVCIYWKFSIFSDKTRQYAGNHFSEMIYFSP